MKALTTITIITPQLKTDLYHHPIFGLHCHTKTPILRLIYVFLKKKVGISSNCSCVDGKQNLQSAFALHVFNIVPLTFLNMKKAV